MDKKYLIRQIAARINTMQKEHPNFVCQIVGENIFNLINFLLSHEKEEFVRCFQQYKLDINLKFIQELNFFAINVFPLNSPLSYETNNKNLKIVYPEMALFCKLEKRIQNHINQFNSKR